MVRSRQQKLYSTKKFCTDGFSLKSCLGQELLHLMLYIVAYSNHFANILLVYM